MRIACGFRTRESSMMLKPGLGGQFLKHRQAGRREINHR